MRIISKRKDYYDIGQRNYDDSIMYVRNSELIVASSIKSEYSEFDKYVKHSFAHRDRSSQRELSFYAITIIFCGKVYPCVRLSTYDYVDSTDEYFYDYDSLDDAVREFNLSFDEILDFGLGFRGNRSLKDHFLQDKDAFDLCSKFKAPIITVVSQPRRFVIVTRNDILSQYQFFKVLDPYSAFQELEMFLGGIMAPENKKMIEISDRYKIEEHGFDKWSFKKAPTKMKK